MTAGMGLCGTCRSWDNSIVKHEPTFGYCKRIAGEGDPLAFVVFYDYGDFRTSEDFGCVLHEPKPDSTETT